MNATLLTTEDIKRILRQEIDHKVGFTALVASICKACESTIAEGDEVYFYGNKQELCNDCYGEVVLFLEEE